MLQVLVAISQKFIAEKKHVAMQKLFIKKREKVLKMDKCLNYQNNRYLDVHLKKKRDE
jgi:hypothetical protein